MVQTATMQRRSIHLDHMQYFQEHVLTAPASFQR